MKRKAEVTLLVIIMLAAFVTTAAVVSDIHDSRIEKEKER